MSELVFAGAALHDAVERADTEVAGDTARLAGVPGEYVGELTRVVPTSEVTVVAWTFVNLLNGIAKDREHARGVDCPLLPAHQLPSLPVDRRG